MHLHQDWQLTLCSLSPHVFREWQRRSDRLSLWLTVCFQISSLWQHSCRTWTPVWPVPQTRWQKVWSPQPQSLRTEQKKGWRAPNQTLQVYEDFHCQLQVTACDSPIYLTHKRLLLHIKTHNTYMIYENCKFREQEGLFQLISAAQKSSTRPVQLTLAI